MSTKEVYVYEGGLGTAIFILNWITSITLIFVSIIAIIGGILAVVIGGIFFWWVPLLASIGIIPIILYILLVARHLWKDIIISTKILVLIIIFYLLSGLLFGWASIGMLLVPFLNIIAIIAMAVANITMWPTLVLYIIVFAMTYNERKEAQGKVTKKAITTKPRKKKKKKKKKNFSLEI
ncbi:MAG: hypothetical protein GF317_06070 [Candidatus Lokiarchaeota archaeon]|nr:hypothetical protein [Candidatus Lokiarchaeota archaeon]